MYNFVYCCWRRSLKNHFLIQFVFETKFKKIYCSRRILGRLKICQKVCVCCLILHFSTSTESMSNYTCFLLLIALQLLSFPKISIWHSIIITSYPTTLMNDSVEVKVITGSNSWIYIALWNLWVYLNLEINSKDQIWY